MCSQVSSTSFISRELLPLCCEASPVAIRWSSESSEAAGIDIVAAAVVMVGASTRNVLGPSSTDGCDAVGDRPDPSVEVRWRGDDDAEDRVDDTDRDDEPLPCSTQTPSPSCNSFGVG